MALVSKMVCEFTSQRILKLNMDGGHVVWPARSLWGSGGRSGLRTYDRWGILHLDTNRTLCRLTSNLPNVVTTLCKLFEHFGVLAQAPQDATKKLTRRLGMQHQARRGEATKSPRRPGVHAQTHLRTSTKPPRHRIQNARRSMPGRNDKAVATS